MYLNSKHTLMGKAMLELLLSVLKRPLNKLARQTWNSRVLGLEMTAAVFPSSVRRRSEKLSSALHYTIVN
jgi:hypothetical protein